VKENGSASCVPHDESDEVRRTLGQVLCCGESHNLERQTSQDSLSQLLERVSYQHSNYLNISFKFAPPRPINHHKPPATATPTTTPFKTLTPTIIHLNVTTPPSNFNVVSGSLIFGNPFLSSPSGTSLPRCLHKGSHPSRGCHSKSLSLGRILRICV
jgi:hypothetical protein